MIVFSKLDFKACNQEQHAVIRSKIADRLYMIHIKRVLIVFVQWHSTRYLSAPSGFYKLEPESKFDNGKKLAKESRKSPDIGSEFLIGQKKIAAAARITNNHLSMNTRRAFFLRLDSMDMFLILNLAQANLPSVV